MTASNAAQILATERPQALVLRSLLTSAFDIITNVVERRNLIPILNNARLIGDGTKLFVTATDLDMEVTVAIPAAADSRLALTLPAHKLKDLLKKATAGEYVGFTMPEITHIDATATRAEHDEFSSRAVVDFEKVKYNLEALPVADFPTTTFWETNHRFALPGALLHDALDSVMGAISTEETRYYLNGIFMHAVDGASGELRLVATDGHRLYKRDLRDVAGCDGMPGVIIPRKTVGLLNRLTKSKNPPDLVEFEVTDSKVRMNYADGDLHVTITSKVIDGTFPDYARVIPTGNDKRLIVDSAALAEAVRAVSLISSQRGRAIRFELIDGECRLTVNNPDEGSSESTIACDYASDPLEIGFNSDYVAEMLKVACPAGGDLTAKLSEPGSPTVFAGGRDGWMAVLMPMRV